MTGKSITADSYSNVNGGITIPQHIIIPPSTLMSDSTGGTGGCTGERKYQINSEITISYDPRRPSTTQQQYSPSQISGNGNIAFSPARSQSSARSLQPQQQVNKNKSF